MFIKIHNSVIKGCELPQSKPTALPAPSGREPLARPQTLHFSRKLSRYAKGPIPEGAVAVGDWGSSGKHPFRLAASRQATFPKGTALAAAIKFPVVPKGVPLGELAANKGSRLRGFLIIISPTFSDSRSFSPHSRRISFVFA